MSGRAAICVLASIVALVVACTESVRVGPEGQFSWEPESQLVWPVPGAIVSAYGDAARPGHRGIDLAAKPGEPVAAARLGKVEYVGEIAGYGRTVVVSHADRLSTVYAHLGSLRVSAGDTVSRGQTIGTISAEGYLHFETRENTQPVDPAKFYAVAPQPGIGVSVDVRKKVADEPSSTGPLGMLGAEPQPTHAATLPEKPQPTATPKLPPTPAPRSTPTAIPTATLPPAPTATPTAIPTATPTPAPTATPTLVPTPRPTPTPRPAPTALPAPTPRLRPTVKPEASSHPQSVPTRPPAPGLTPASEPASPAGAQSSGDRWGSVGMGAALFGANLLYVPAKLAYAGVGAVTGTIALVLAHDTEVANSIWVPTMRGDYIVTEKHLRGETALQFLGSAP